MATTTSKVFVGSLPHTISEEALRTKVEVYGKVVTLFYMADQLQQQRGWAFVTYSTHAEALRAIQEMDQKLKFEGYDKPVECRFANQKPTAAPGGGAAGNAFTAPVPTVWQQFFTPEGHPYYYNTQTGITQWERPPEMDKPQLASVPRSLPPRAEGPGGSSFGPPGSNLFVFHLPNDWNDIDLIQHFQHFGEILSARIQRDTEGRNRGFGFVSFSDQRAAIHAIRGMHGFNVGGKFLKVQLKKGEELHLTPAMKALLPNTHLPGAAGFGTPTGANYGGQSAYGAAPMMGAPAYTPGMMPSQGAYGNAIPGGASTAGYPAGGAAQPVRYAPY